MYMHFPLNDGGRRRGKIQRYKDRSGLWTCGLRYYPNDLVTGAAENRKKNLELIFRCAEPDSRYLLASGHGEVKTK